MISEQKLKGYYIIAPENAESGNIADPWEQVWQYGSNEATTPAYDQDGVAPQKAVGNIGQRRAYIPDSYATPIVKSVLYMPTLGNPNPAPLYITTTAVPKGFADSHSIANYGWIFEIANPQTPGYVIPK